ncbi:hypothetical protein DLJ58_20180 [Micromonospora arida]|uniref:Uncharacterized protein n=1 Tax=Micromonospora arida TaxID=2203715 RepID=A0A3N9X4A6_9ACTN|nr:hypothetical protein DLJ58_20180 [Micromonospora arida]
MNVAFSANKPGQIFHHLVVNQMGQPDVVGLLFEMLPTVASLWRENDIVGKTNIANMIKQ